MRQAVRPCRFIGGGCSRLVCRDADRPWPWFLLAEGLSLRKLVLRLHHRDQAALLARHTALESLTVTVVLDTHNDDLGDDAREQQMHEALNAVGEALPRLMSLRELHLDANDYDGGAASVRPWQLPRSLTTLVAVLSRAFASCGRAPMRAALEAFTHASSRIFCSAWRAGTLLSLRLACNCCAAGSSTRHRWKACATR